MSSGLCRVSAGRDGHRATMRHRFRSFLPAIAILLLGPAIDPAGNAASAQTLPPAAAAPRVPPEPGVTIASFGDWVMRCQRTAEPDKPVRICEVGQAMQVQGQPAPVAQVGIGRIAAGDPLRLTVVLPINVFIPAPVHVVAGGAGVDLAWQRCLPGGCFADAEMKEPVLQRWREAAEPGRIAFKDAAGRDVTIPLSFRGLSQALDALAKEAI